MDDLAMFTDDSPHMHAPPDDDDDYERDAQWHPDVDDDDDQLDTDGDEVPGIVGDDPQGEGDDGLDGEDGDEVMMEPVDEMDYEPTEQEILEYCEWLNMDPVSDRQLMWIAREALKAPLPENWRQCYTDDREVYYFNVRTGESIWDHPMDAYYKSLFKQEKAKLDKKRRHMRLFSGSMEIQPVADFFSDISDTCGVGLDEADDDPNAAWKTVPETLIDAIDFRIYIDPVVLPTSGRTVSRHTIINNKWRDPFSREYVENRRLVPNVDKRIEVENHLSKMVSEYMAGLSYDAKGMTRLVAILPFLLDKEEEVCVRGQRLLLDWMKAGLAPPKKDSTDSAPQSARSNAESDSGTTVPSARVRAGSTRSMGKSQSSKSLTRSKLQNAKTRANTMQSPPAPPPPPPLLSVLKGLNEADQVPVVLGAFLTMSSSSSREALLRLLQAVPSYAGHTTFKGFNEHVLHVLHLSPTDLSRVAANLIEAAEKAQNAAAASALSDMELGLTGSSSPNVPRLPSINRQPQQPPNASSDAPPTAATPPSKDDDSAARAPAAVFSALTVRNSEHLLALEWVHFLQATEPPGVNALYALEFVAAAHIVMAMHATPELKAQNNVLTKLLRGSNGWPTALASCDDDHVKALLQIAMEDKAPLSRVTTIFDICLHGGERCLDVIKAHAETIRGDLMHLAKNLQTSGDTTPVTSSPVDMLGAVLVFHEIMKLDEFAEVHPQLALKVGFNLGPRLTRSQWRPKHFHQTVGRLIQLCEEHPLAAWGTVTSQGLFFFLKELSKKKSSSDEVRGKLEGIEASERQLEQSTAITRWGVLTVKMMQRRRRNCVEDHLSQKKTTSKPATQRQKSKPVVEEDDVEEEIDSPPSPSTPKAGANPREEMWNSRRTSKEDAPKETLKTHLASLQKKLCDIQREQAANTVAVLNVLMGIRLKPKQRGDRAATDAKSRNTPGSAPSTPKGEGTAARRRKLDTPNANASPGAAPSAPSGARGPSRGQSFAQSSLQSVGSTRHNSTTGAAGVSLPPI